MEEARGLRRRVPEAYFETVRKARDAVKFRPEYQGPTRAMNVTPDQVEEAFLKANPGLSRAGIAVTCNSTRLSEVRICMTRELKFRECREVDRQACPRPQVVMPPVRGGNSAIGLPCRTRHVLEFVASFTKCS